MNTALASETASPFTAIEKGDKSSYAMTHQQALERIAKQPLNETDADHAEHVYRQIGEFFIDTDMHGLREMMTSMSSAYFTSEAFNNQFRNVDDRQAFAERYSALMNLLGLAERFMPKYVIAQTYGFDWD